MPQYELRLVSSNQKEHIYVRYAKEEDAAKDFVPQVIINDDFDNPVPLEGELVSIKEMEIYAIFQLDQDSYEQVKQIAEQHGLQARKAVGAFCLEVTGRGDWIESDWVKNYFMRATNWIHFRFRRTS